MSDTATSELRVYENVVEIDGPPMAYFEIPMIVSNGGPLYVERIVYQLFELLAAPSLREALEVAGAATIDKIRVHVNKTGGIIWWRRHPSVAVDETEKKLRWSCRLQTSPPLSDEFLKSLQMSDNTEEHLHKWLKTL